MIKVGILGTGFGKTHANIYSKLENIEIAGVFGRSSDKLKKDRGRVRSICNR